MIPGLSEEKAVEAARLELQQAQVVMEKRPEEALGHLLEGRRLDPGNLEIALNLARAEVRLARYSDAIGSLQRVLALDDSSDEAMSLSSLCHLKMRRLDKAEEYARASLTANVDNSLAREIFSDCLRARGEWKQAMDEINLLLAEDTDMDEGPKARLNLKLAHCLLRIGSHVQAWEITQLLLRNGYAGKQVQIIHRECVTLNKAEISAGFGKSGIAQRLLLWVASRHILLAFAVGRKRRLGFEGPSGLESSEIENGVPHEHS